MRTRSSAGGVLDRGDGARPERGGQPCASHASPGLDYYKLSRRCASTPALTRGIGTLPGFVEVHVNEAIQGDGCPFQVELARAARSSYDDRIGMRHRGRGSSGRGLLEARADRVRRRSPQHVTTNPNERVA